MIYNQKIKLFIHYNQILKIRKSVLKTFCCGSHGKKYLKFLKIIRCFCSYLLRKKTRSLNFVKSYKWQMVNYQREGVEVTRMQKRDALSRNCTRKYCKLILQLTEEWSDDGTMRLEVSWSPRSGISLDISGPKGDHGDGTGWHKHDISNLEATSSLLRFLTRTLQFRKDPQARWYPHSFFGTNSFNVFAFPQNFFNSQVPLNKPTRAFCSIIQKLVSNSMAIAEFSKFNYNLLELIIPI